MKVVYIASPMMLTARPEEFRAVVQELTGRHSNIADRQYVDSPPPPPSCAGINVPSATATAAAPPPPVSVVSAAAALPAAAAPLPRQQMFQPDGHGEHEQAAGNMCYGQGYYW
uniref:VQ domain-containing protein n=1 Tax=Leersia perrieri TaxID=77586 RepID=A0A0D9X340_9ORYZ